MMGAGKQRGSGMRKGEQRRARPTCTILLANNNTQQHQHQQHQHTHTHAHTQHQHTQQEGDGVSPTAVREVALLRELRHPNVVRLEAVHADRALSSLSLAFDYAEHDLYEMVWHHRDRIGGESLIELNGFESWID